MQSLKDVFCLFFSSKTVFDVILFECLGIYSFAYLLRGWKKEEYVVWFVFDQSLGFALVAR